MTQPDNPFSARFIMNPLYWPMWLLLGILRLCIMLPYPLICRFARALSMISFTLMTERRRVMRTNIRLCYPDYDKQQVNRLVRDCFYSGTMMLFESALSWWGKQTFFDSHSYVEGLEHVKAAQGKGILYLGAHTSTVDISSRITMEFIDRLIPTYKPARNQLFNAFVQRARIRNHGDIIQSTNLREVLKRLKQNDAIWYAPDQDFGYEGSVFAPFMGIPTATLTTTARIARATGAVVIPWYSERLPDYKGYKTSFGPALENFPLKDEIANATAVNQVIESQIQKAPEQYLWGHRRFKTRPRGEAQLYQPRRDKSMRRYTYAHCLLSLPVILYTLYIALKNKNPLYFKQRLGLTTPPAADLIIHAASIGEVNGIAPLLQHIHKHSPQLKILLSVNTPSGMSTARNLFGDTVNYHFMPVDWHWLAYRYLLHVNPQCVLVMETEIWPNFFEYCFYRGIKNIIVNARLSSRSMEAPRFILQWLSLAIQYSTAVLARSEEDAERYRKLGAHAENVKVLGNIKYAVKSYREQTAFQSPKPYILLASSRDDEEKLIVSTWLSLQRKDMLLVIVPRHIGRLNKILADLATLTERIAVRSRNDLIAPDTQIYIADTFGELPLFIAAAEFIIMGGSFEPYGGQNLIEVAAAGKAVIFGKHMDNFRSEAEQFVKHGAALKVSDQSELKYCISYLLQNPERVTELGNNGYALVQQYQDIIQRYIAEISTVCTPLASTRNQD